MQTQTNKKEVIDFFAKHSDYYPSQVRKLQRIKNGFTNESYYIHTDDNQKYLVRFTRNQNLNRKNEKLIFNALNIKLIYFDENGNLIKPWIEGKICSHWNKAKINSFVTQLKLINNIKLEAIEDFDPYIFFNLLDKTKDKDIIKEYNFLVKKHQNDNKCVCHSDLNPNNILYNKQNKQIYLIDFEWVKNNNVYWELANFAREKLTKKQMLYLLQIYGLDDFNSFKDYLIITCLYAYQWSLSVKQTKSIKKYQKHIFKRLKKIRSF